jgi:hypothetical protein
VKLHTVLDGHSSDVFGDPQESLDFYDQANDDRRPHDRLTRPGAAGLFDEYTHAHRRRSDGDDQQAAAVNARSTSSAPTSDGAGGPMRVAVIGPTAMTWDEIATDVEPDLARLRDRRSS